MVPFDYAEPETLEETLALLQEYGDEAKLLAGGTALIVFLKKELAAPSLLINLKRLTHLKEIQEMGDGLRIGPLATHREIERSAAVRRRLPVLAETFHKVATPRIRNMGTLGGNLCHGDPNVDPPSTLLALGTRVKLVSTRGEREIPLEDFFVDYYETVKEPDELLTEVMVSDLPAAAVAAHIKFLPKTQDDFATVGIAAVVTLEENGATPLCRDIRLALNAVASRVTRAREAEGVLRGKALTPEALKAAAEAAAREVDPIHDVRGSSAYKREMVKVMVQRVIRQALEKRQPA